jgi:hypothetical protein
LFLINLEGNDMSGYLRFNRTGNEKFDAVLDRIEEAGDCYHHTSQWNEDISYREDGKSCIDLINEAIDAAIKEGN